MKVFPDFHRSDFPLFLKKFKFPDFIFLDSAIFGEKERKISCKRREKEGSVECNVPISRGEDPKTNLNSQRERERKGKKDRERERVRRKGFLLWPTLSQ